MLLELHIKLLTGSNTEPPLKVWYAFNDPCWSRIVVPISPELDSFLRLSSSLKTQDKKSYLTAEDTDFLCCESQEGSDQQSERIAEGGTRRCQGVHQEFKVCCLQRSVLSQRL